ncbi:adenosylhomocysteinase [Inquilinus sp.]|jgi:adenosylhomocysteinase|uniref:adenosylhomocysteinase n=1 Tax=Inquilinus sp. TaxID=1932117 RepID=UPI0037833ABD
MAESLSRIDWVGRSCRLLRATAAEFLTTRPFEGLTIGTGIHLEPKTVALLTTLGLGGARLVCTGNLNSTQPETVEHLRAQGATVFATQTTDPAEHAASLDAVLAEQPDLLLDNGGDLFARVAAGLRYPRLRGGTEETTSGRARLLPLREALAMPVLVINDSPIKQFAENRHAVGQSLFESYLRFTNRSTQGKRVTVFGYGACGKGTAACFRNGFAAVSVVDIDPVAALEAHLDGFATPLRDQAIRSADILVTVTGHPGVLTAADLPLLRDGAILMNGGHFPTEIDAGGLRAGAVEVERYEAEGIETLRLADGRRVHLLGGGHMANLAGPRPLGNTVESMDLGFTLQARCLERVAKGGAGAGAESCVVPVPADIDAAVASAYLDLAR